MVRKDLILSFFPISEKITHEKERVFERKSKLEINENPAVSKTENCEDDDETEENNCDGRIVEDIASEGQITSSNSIQKNLSEKKKGPFCFFFV